jgi:Pyridoxal-dependent decarboxylase, C-terminal sheet domain
VLGGFLTTMSALPWFVEERLTWDPLPPGEELDHVRRALGDLAVTRASAQAAALTLRDVERVLGAAPAADADADGVAAFGVECRQALATLRLRARHVRDEAVTIAGQLCTPKDVLARRVRVSRLRALRVGDLVAFGLAGAYAWNISHHEFLMHPPPAFHYLA